MARDDHYPLSISLAGGSHSIDATELEEEGAFRLETTGGDPYIPTTPLTQDINATTGSILLKFKYKNNNITNAQFFFAAPNPAGGESTPKTWC